MDTKQIEVTCPCCSAKLSIDVRTESVLRTAPPERVDETGKVVLDEGRWDAALDRVSSRTESSRDGFDEALKKEQSSEKDLDERFEKAKEKVARRKDERDPA